MGFTIEVELLRGLYDAGSFDERHGEEWPPSPARLTCALLAVTESDNDRAALRWLEEQPPPAITASAAPAITVCRESYVPLNETKGGVSYGRFPGRTAGALQQWRHVCPAVPYVRFHWSTDPDVATLDRLNALAGEVAYLGRSTSPVEMTASASPLGAIDDRHLFVAGGTEDTRVVSLPRPGFVSELQAAYDEGRSAHEVPRRSLRYGREAAVASVIHQSVFDPNFLVLPFANGRRVGAAFSLGLSNAVRKAMESVLDGGPLVLRGARPGENRPRHQMLITGLPDVGHEHAGGMIAGVAIVLPTDIAPDDRQAIFSALSAIEDNGVTAGQLGVLSFDTMPSPLRALDPSRWCRPSKGWVTATPMTLDRFVDVRKVRQVERQIERACDDVDLPSPTVVEISTRPLLEGASTIPANLRVRRRGDQAKPSLHVRIEFDIDVEGPVVLGNLRRYGLGLFLPEPRAGDRNG